MRTVRNLFKLNIRMMMLSYGLAVLVLLVLGIWLSRMKKEQGNPFTAHEYRRQMRQMQWQNRMNEDIMDMRKNY